MKQRAAGLLLIAGLAAAPAAPAQDPAAGARAQDAAPAARAQDAAVSDYTIGVRDVLGIQVLELPELNVDRRVNDSGMIDLPLIGQIQAAGSNATEVRDRIVTALTKYVNQPNVLVSIKEFNNKPVSVFGAVLRPGALSISGKWTLMQAISAAGGLSDKAGRRILVLRRAENGLSDTLEIDTEDLFQNATELWNIPILPADVINIPPRQSFAIFCLGAVRNAGAIQFETTDRVTLLSLVAKAGGLTDRASKKIRIKRRAPDGKDVEQIVDFGKVLAGEVDDPILQANDVIFVKESFF